MCTLFLFYLVGMLVMTLILNESMSFAIQAFQSMTYTPKLILVFAACAAAAALT